MEKERDSFSLSALLPWTLCAVVLLYLVLPKVPSLHRFLSVFLSFTLCSTTLHSFLVTLCIYRLHHPTIPAAIHPAHPQRQTLSEAEAPSNNCVRYKVYFILHFIVYFSFLYIRADGAGQPSPALIFFWPPCNPHIVHNTISSPEYPIGTFFLSFTNIL